MHTTLNWHVDAITKDICFDGVIDARDVVSLHLSPGQRERLSAPVLTAADFLEVVALIFRAAHCSPKDSSNASK